MDRHVRSTGQGSHFKLGTVRSAQKYPGQAGNAADTQEQAQRQSRNHAAQIEPSYGDPTTSGDKPPSYESTLILKDLERERKRDEDERKRKEQKEEADRNFEALVARLDREDWEEREQRRRRALDGPRWGRR
jgi:hypothetical protein